jgi:hypothetical protein
MIPAEYGRRMSARGTASALPPAISKASAAARWRWPGDGLIVETCSSLDTRDRPPGAFV